MSIITFIVLIIALIIFTIALIEVLPYSDNETICNIQMTTERIIGRLFEMK